LGPVGLAQFFQSEGFQTVSALKKMLFFPALNLKAMVGTPCHTEEFIAVTVRPAPYRERYSDPFHKTWLS